MTIPGIANIFSRCAGENPEHMALWSAEGTISYRDLDEQSSSLAVWLQDAQSSTRGPTGIMLPKSISAVVSILASLKAGIAYVPIDPTWPAKRLESVFRQSQFDILISTNKFIEKYGRYCTALDVKSPNWIEATMSRSREYCAVAVDASALAYILYTSGSTGDPKGVCISHRAAHYFPDWARREFAVDNQCRIASVAPFTFDLSTFDLFSGLCGGASVYLVPDAVKLLPSSLSRFLEEHAITTLYSVPSNLGLLAARGVLHRRDLHAMRTILFAGEEFPLPLFEDFRSRLPGHVRYANLYGPTETNVCTWFDTVHLAETDRSIPIGLPLPGFELFTLQDDLIGRSDSEEGELCAIGPGVMSGYWGLETDTCWAPTVAGNADPAYRTGDLAARRDDGNWVYKGRLDNMVKIWGYRVELGEIESCLLSVEGIQQAAVVKVNRDGEFSDTLVGFVVSGENHPDDARPLLVHCKENLPPYMRPKTIQFLDRMPMSHNGKIERRKLVELAGYAMNP